MAAQPNQIGRRAYANANWRWFKRETARYRRRQEKQLGEDAPRRNYYRGWAS